MNQLRQPPILMRMNATDSDNPQFSPFYNPHSLYHKRQHIRQLLLLHPLIPNPIKMKIRDKSSTLGKKTAITLNE